MIALKKLINVFYPENKVDSPIAIGTAIPVKFKPFIETSLFTFINFALESDIFMNVTGSNDLNLFMFKSESKERKITSGNIGTADNDFNINLNIESQHKTLMTFSVYVSEINGEKADLIFRFVNENQTGLTKEDLQQFISRTLNTLF